MDKGTTTSGIPVFGEIVKLLDKQTINNIAEKMNANRYTKRLDAYQHLVIMLYAQLGQFESLRDVELGFLCAALRMNNFGSDEVVMLSWRKSIIRPMTAEELSHRRGRRPKSCVVMTKETKRGKHKCRRVTKWKDSRDEGTITFITNDLDTPATVICETYRRCWQIETLFKRLKQNFFLKYFLGDNRNAIQIQIRVSLIAWLLMQVVKKQMPKRKWSLSNLMMAVPILLNSYIDLYDLLNLPEGQWLKIIKNRSPEDEIATQLELFPQKEGPVSENYMTKAYLQAISQE